MKIQYYFNQPLEVSCIKDTFEASFKQQLSAEYWRWRFLSNPVSDKVYIAYCMDGDILAGYYAVSPVRLNDGKRSHMIAHSNMTMTHPDYQGQGLFKLLSDGIFKELSNDGFIGVYGFANHNSHYGFRKHMNWQDLAALSNFSLDKSQLKKQVTDYEVKGAVLNADIYNTTPWIANARYCFNRDDNYFKWRFIDCPNQYSMLQVSTNDQVVANVVYKEYQGALDVMEIYFRGSDIDLLTVWGSIATKVFEMGFSSINIWSNLHTNEHLALERVGFTERTFATYLGVIPFKNCPVKTDNIRDWHYRFADSDVY